MQRIGGEWYLLTSSGDTETADANEYPVYDTEMEFVGFLDAPHPTNIPWPMVVPIPLARGRTKYVMITFNGDQYRPDVLGYGTHGDVFVMEAAETVSGREFPP